MSNQEHRVKLTEREYTTYKAAPIGDQVIPNVKINITKDDIDLATHKSQAERMSMWEQRYRTLYESEANEIELLLRNSLPGGTYDALLVAMLDHKRSLFKVPI